MFKRVKIQLEYKDIFQVVFHTRSDENTKYNDFSGRECDNELVKNLEGEAREIFDEFWERSFDINLTEKDQLLLPDDEIIKNDKIKFEFRYRLKYKFMPMKEYNIGKREKETATKCYLCDVDFYEEDKKVIDHDHVQGKYLGIAHDKCNLRRMTKPVLKVFFHNINYDVPQMIRKFVKNHGFRAEVRCVPKSKEKFMTLTKKLDFGEEVILDKKTWKKKFKKFWFDIQIVDSISFLGGSLDKVVSSLSKTEFKHLEREVSRGDKVKFELFTQKGYFHIPI